MALDYQTPPNQEREPPNWWVLIVISVIAAGVLGYGAVMFFTMDGKAFP